MKERPARELIRLGGPIAASTISYSLMTLVDTLLVGRIGRSELAGVALGGLSSFVLICFPLGLLRATNTLVSQAVGADQRDRVPDYRRTAALVALGLGVATAALGQLAAAAVEHLAATPAAGQAARQYLAVRILGAPIVLTYNALREARYGQGDTRTPMVATVLANVVNIALAYLFIFVLDRGVAGAALAAVLAHLVELGVILWAGRGEARGRAGRAEFADLWRVGAPTGVQFLLEVGSFAILSLLISLRSEAEMAAHQIAIQVIHFSFLPAWAVGEAACTLAGQAVGAAEDDLVIRNGRIAAVLTGAYSAACALLFAAAAGWIAGGSTPDAAVVSVATRLLWVAAVFQIFDALNVVARGVLRGAGDVRYSATVGVITAWICTPPLTWLLGWRLGWGALGGWIGLCLEIMVGAAVLGARVERRGWAAAATASRARLGVRAAA